MSEVKFYCLPNLATDSVTVLDEPWNVKVEQAVLDLPKDEYKKRWLNPATKHYLLLMTEGQNKDYCVSVGNQAAVIYGFMADYDGVLTDDLIESLKRKPQSKYAPRYWAKSHSGKLHLIWFFERPVAVAGNAHANALLKAVARKIKAAKWGVGYDPSCESATQVLDIGREWHVFREDAAIPTEEIILWDFAIFESGAKSVAAGVVSMPFDVVAAEIKKRTWPHPPPLDVRVGTRCIRFWDASADNESAAQFTKDGLRVYTPHDNGFVTWRTLFGAEFCEQYTAKSLAPFIEDTYYCHTKDGYVRFFRNDDPPHYEQRTEKVLRRDLIQEAKLSAKPAKGEAQSEVDDILYAISRRNAVSAVAPVIYRKTGRIYVREIGDSVLNTSLVVVKKPAGRLFEAERGEDLAARYPRCPSVYRDDPSLCSWDNPFAVEGFPNIHRLITSFFVPNKSTYEAWREDNFALQDSTGRSRRFFGDVQLLSLVSWLAHFYKNAAYMSECPGRGQALILAGPPGVGKSFFARCVLGQLMGGSVDAARYYLDAMRFNSDIISSPVHLIDDSLGSRSHHARLQFTESMKIVVANAVLRYEAKFGNAIGTVPWAGRIVVLANDDAQSMSVMPDLDMSTRDKFMMLKLGPVKFGWGTDAENQTWVAHELPYFARFLLGWKTPDGMYDARFGVKAMQHSDMAQASAENGLTQVLVDILETCIETTTGAADEADRGDAEGFVVEGPAVKILKWIRSVDESLAREMIDSRTLQQCLNTLYKNGGYNITVNPQNHWWRIPYVLRKPATPPSDPRARDKEIVETVLTPYTEI